MPSADKGTWPKRPLVGSYSVGGCLSPFPALGFFRVREGSLFATPLRDVLTQGATTGGGGVIIKSSRGLSDMLPTKQAPVGS